MTVSPVSPVEPAEAAIGADFTVEDITGRWRSPAAAEVFPGIWGIDDFWIQSPFWGIHFNSYSDPDCRGRLFELLVMGAFELAGQNAAVAGARDANFSRVKVGLVLYGEELINAANAAGSGNGRWKAGEWQDVSLRGCAPIDVPGIEQCPLEYDLLGLARGGSEGGGADRLYFGQRHHDAAGSICTRRAPGLLDYYVVRVVGAPPAVGHGAGFGPGDWTAVTSSLTPVPISPAG
jgi:hypothetical protein